MKTIPVLCCSVLKKEITAILAKSYPEAEAHYLDSMLHMRPSLLEKTVENRLEMIDENAVVIYGDCEPSMESIERRHGAIRTKAVNCCELLAGKELYEELKKNQAFILLPEWTERWKEVFQKELGFIDQGLAENFMHEYRNGIVYLDTGLYPVPEKTLAEIEEYFNMKVTVRSVGLEHLRRYVSEAIDRYRETRG